MSADYPDQRPSPCESGDEVVRGHLEGRDTIGLYPLLVGDTCRLLVCDFDHSSWKRDAQAYVAAADFRPTCGMRTTTRTGDVSGIASRSGLPQAVGEQDPVGAAGLDLVRVELDAGSEGLTYQPGRVLHRGVRPRVGQHRSIGCVATPMEAARARVERTALVAADTTFAPPTGRALRPLPMTPPLHGRVRLLCGSCSSEAEPAARLLRARTVDTVGGLPKLEGEGICMRGADASLPPQLPPGADDDD